MDSKWLIGLQISEPEYRALPHPSYSRLSDIRKIGELAMGPANKNIADLDGIICGKIVDGLVTENTMPPGIIVVAKKPTGKAKDIIKALTKYKSLLVNPEEILHKDNEDIITKVCDKMKYFKALDKRMKGLRNYEEYIEVMKTCDQESIVISSYLYQDSLKLVKLIKNQYDWLINPEKHGIMILPQVKLVQNVDGLLVKGMLDFIVIDEKNKAITPFDLKTGASKCPEFYTKGYLGWNYYIQSGLYWYLLRAAMDKHPIYFEYKLKDFKFLYAGRFDKQTIIHTVEERERAKAWIGFTENVIDEQGKEVEERYEGISELLRMYKSYL